MKADKTDKLIQSAIAALPYHRPSAGFSARVMASLAAVPEPWQARLLRPTAIIVAAWSAMVAFLSAGAVYRVLSYGAGLALEPGGLDAGLRLVSARLALAAGKAAAALACTLIIYSVGAFRPAAQRI